MNSSLRAPTQMDSGQDRESPFVQDSPCYALWCWVTTKSTPLKLMNLPSDQVVTFTESPDCHFNSFYRNTLSWWLKMKYIFVNINSVQRMYLRSWEEHPKLGNEKFPHEIIIPAPILVLPMMELFSLFLICMGIFGMLFSIFSNHTPRFTYFFKCFDR